MNNSKTEKMVNFIFVLVFVGMIFLPFCLLDTTEIIDSSLENRRMTMWPGWHFNQEINAWYGHYVEDRVEKARSEGFNCGKASISKTGEGAKEFIAFLQLNKIPGIGAVTINKLIKVAEENGYL